ncbi:MAG: PASTA domain-containing protein [Bacteroidales bacterium]|nr:PASTA domain-containing protein [Bacteroidales bacterium]
MKKIFKHILISFVVLFILVCGVLAALHFYTRHDQSIKVPDVKGLDMNEAAPFFDASQLSYEVIDSVFSKSNAPGSIVETIPAPGSKVKQGRKIFVTINAYSTQTGLIPSVADVSFRQVQAMLQGLGFENVQVEYVPGEYRDLVIGITGKGKQLQPGERIALTTPIRILVSNGSTEPQDSISPENNTEMIDNESWF